MALRFDLTCSFPASASGRVRRLALRSVAAVCGMLALGVSAVSMAEDEPPTSPLIKTAIFTRVYGSPTIPHIMKLLSSSADADSPAAQSSGSMIVQGLKKSSMPMMGVRKAAPSPDAVAPAAEVAETKKFNPGLAPYHPNSVGRSTKAAAKARPVSVAPDSSGANVTRGKIPVQTVSYARVAYRAAYYGGPYAADYSWAWWNGYPYAVGYYRNYPYYGYLPTGPYVVPYTFAYRPAYYGPSFYGPVTYPAYYPPFSNAAAYWTGYGVPYYYSGFSGPFGYRSYVYW